MLKMRQSVYVLCLLALMQTAKAQLNISHELGVVAGPVQFRSDFGVKNDSKTNFGNSGLGVGIVHYINFTRTADCDCYPTNSYFSDHFKLRNELSYNKTNLEHHGEFVDASKTSADADRLRAHKGAAKNLDIGTQLEFFPLSIRSFRAYNYRFAPFVSLGVHYTFFNPEVSTDYANPNPSAVGDVTDSSNFYSGWAPGSVDASSGSAWSVVSSVGVRYKLNKLSDLMLDLRLQHYFDDRVDGLNHQLDSNKNNDSLVWLSLGYIYYLN